MGISGGGAYLGPQEVRYLFVDGGYLRKVAEKFSREFFDGADLPINYQALGSQFTRCFYYDCLPAQSANGESVTNDARLERQREQLSEIRSLHGWHVVEGVMAGTGNRARQKQVDVHIAVDLLTHSYRKNMHRAAFIAGDQDFKPLVEAVVRDGMLIEIWFERSSASRDLLDAADGRKPLDLYEFYRYLERPFKDAHPLPKRWVNESWRVMAGELQRSGECREGSVDLYCHGGEYTIVGPSQGGGGRYRCMGYDNLDLLERVFASQFGEITWRKAPVAPTG
ncbi:MAG: NYN domain-containing protein [Chloroflexi bacterium]|nr:NYN domain-containing protein [Chloroflexota bacterium]